MKNLFGGFYGVSEEATKALWVSDKSVFVFDTNALLLLYRCERETREAFFSQWEKIRDRVFLPYHVCLEYQRNRLTAIKDHVLELRNAGSHIARRVIDASDIEQFEPKQAATIRRYESLRGKVTELSKLLQSTVDKFVKEQIDSRIKEADFLSSHDTVRDRISELANSCIGTAPTQEYIVELEKLGEDRFKKQIPPGFEDAKTKGDQVFTYDGVTYKRKFGDWFIWHEILTYTSSNKPDAVIFVTNDNKKDWLFETGGQIRGPLESLKTEIANKGEGTQFLLYNSASFLVAANNHLQGKTTAPEVIKELERASGEQIKHNVKNEWLENFFRVKNLRLKDGKSFKGSDMYKSDYLCKYNKLHGERDIHMIENELKYISHEMKNKFLTDSEKELLFLIYTKLLEEYVDLGKGDGDNNDDNKIDV